MAVAIALALAHVSCGRSGGGIACLHGGGGSDGGRGRIAHEDLDATSNSIGGSSKVHTATRDLRGGAAVAFFFFFFFFFFFVFIIFGKNKYLVLKAEQVRIATFWGWVSRALLFLFP